MTDSSLSIEARIPANKFFPPRANTVQFLVRERLISFLSQNCPNKKLTLIDAQAGQGKSVLVSQLLPRLTQSYIWYQLGNEDRDPVLFVSALVYALKTKLAGFASTVVENILVRGDVKDADITAIINVLLADLDQFLTGDLFVIFEDIHVMENSAKTCSILQQLIETSTPKVHFIITTRHPEVIDLHKLKASRELCHIKNDQLAFNVEEISAIYNKITAAPLNPKLAQRYFQITEGWIMGLVMLLYSPHQHVPDEKPRDKLPNPANSSDTHDYFRREYFRHIPQTMQHTLIKLSLLHEIDVDLAKQITLIDGIREQLLEMANKNLFVRAINDEKSLFVFHHLMQEFLRIEAAKYLSKDGSAALYRTAADYYLQKAQTENAIIYYLNAGMYARAEEILHSYGPHLLGLGRHVSLMRILEMFPREYADGSPWISFLFGSALFHENPPQALPYLNKAKEGFAKIGFTTGELLTLTQLIIFHLFAEGRAKIARPYLARCEQLMPQTFQDLQGMSKAQVCLAMAWGKLFVSGEIEQALSWCSKGVNIADENDFLNMIVSFKFVEINCFIFRIKWRQAAVLLDTVYPLLHDIRVSPFNRLLIYTMQINLLALIGDSSNFEYYVNLLSSISEQNLLTKSIVAPYLLSWRTELRIASGKMHDALDVLEQGLILDHQNTKPHLRSQYSYYLAYLTALNGECDKAVTAAEQAILLQSQVDSPLYVPITNMVVGLGYLYANKISRADMHFAIAIDSGNKLHGDYMTTPVLINRAYYKITHGEQDTALEDIRQALLILKKQEYRNFYTWTPHIIQRVLEHAVATGVESEFARDLARDRLAIAIQDNGASIPILKVHTLGGLSFQLGDKAILSEEDLTQYQRNMLALVLIANGFHINQVDIQLILWPDHPPEKARTNLDTLLSRFRKILAPRLGRLKLQNYFQLTKGVLKLDNCRTDHLSFQQYASQGLELLKQNAAWQASNAFRTAYKYWNGPFMPLVSGAYSVDDYREKLNQLFTKMANSWYPLLAAQGQFAEAEELLYAAYELNSCDDGTVRCLYQLYFHQGKTGQTIDLLNKYRQNLRREEYAEQDIERILAAVTAHHIQ